MIIRKQTDYAIDVSVDAILGIKTFVRVPVDADRAARNIVYDPLPYRSLCAIARHLPVSRDDILLDLGCGKGRVLCFFGLRRIKKCLGIEISERLAGDALSNVRRLRVPHSSIEITRSDAIDAEIGNASIIYMFNPFSAEVLAPIVERIRDSLGTKPRHLRICYANPAQSHLLDCCAWLTCVDRFMVDWNGSRACPVAIWTARLDALSGGHRELSPLTRPCDIES